MQRIRILVVDDEEFNLKILAEDLERNGYSTVEAMDGRKACDILQKDRRFDLILLDRMMPGMDGMQVLANIKNDINLRHIPVIMVTAASSKEEILEGVAAGVYHYLTKPYDIKLLLALIKKCAGNSAIRK